MEKSILKNYYRPMLEQNSFRPIPCPEKFGPAGQCWELDPAAGSGYYWGYAKRDLFDMTSAFTRISAWRWTSRSASASSATTPSPGRS